MSTAPGTFARQLLPRVAETLLAVCRGPQRPLQHLEKLRHARWLLERAETLLIEAARSEGATWGDVARARGTSRQNERQAQARRDAAAAREPFDRWLDGVRAQQRERRRRQAG